MPSLHTPADTRPASPPSGARAARARGRGAFAVGAALALSGCLDMSGLSGLDDLTDALGGTGELVEIAVSGPTTVAVGDTVRLAAWGTPTGIIGMLMYDRLLDAEWSTSAAEVATVEVRLPPPGDSTTTTEALVRGVQPGGARITARARGKSASLTVRVVAAP